MELVVLLVGSAALGVIRPRWTTLLAALAPLALAFALAIAAGVVAGRRVGKSPRPPGMGGHR